MRLLIAEDDPVAALVAQRIAEIAGFEVDLAETGAEAWNQLQQGHPDIVLTDWLMPDMSGIELCQRVRGAGAGEKAPYIIVLTALTAEADRLEALAAGANEVLVKPIVPEELLARLTAARAVGPAAAVV